MGKKRLSRIRGNSKPARFPSQVFYGLVDTISQVEGSVLEAYILVSTEPSALWSVAEAALKIDGVKLAHAVTGQFDVVALVEFVKMDYLGKIIDRIQHLEGVLRTQTLIAVPPPVRE